MASSIVVGFKGSGASAAAVWWAAARANSHDLRLNIVCSCPARSGAPDEVSALDGLAAAVRERYPSVHVTISIVDGPPCEALIAARRDAQLLVLGSSDEFAVEDPRLRQLCRQVQSETTGPYVVVHDNGPRADRHAGLGYECRDGCPGPGAAAGGGPGIARCLESGPSACDRRQQVDPGSAPGG